MGAAVVLVIGGGLYGLKKFAEPDAPAAVAADPTTSFDAGAGPGQKPRIVPLPWTSASAASVAPSAAQQPTLPPAPSEAPATEAARDAQQAANDAAEQPVIQKPAPVQPETAASAADANHDSAIDAMANMSKMNLNGNKK